MITTSRHQPEFALAGVLLKRLLAGSETGGAFCLFDNRSDGRSQTPVHVHANDDETIYMLEGEMHVVVAGETRVIGPGEIVFVSRNLPHQLMNTSGKPMRYLLLCTPGGFEDFVSESGYAVAEGEKAMPPTLADAARMSEAAPRFGITLLSGW